MRVVKTEHQKKGGVREGRPTIVSNNHSIRS
jgi:hypothetical protein